MMAMTVCSVVGAVLGAILSVAQINKTINEHKRLSSKTYTDDA